MLIFAQQGLSAIFLPIFSNRLAVLDPIHTMSRNGVRISVEFPNIVHRSKVEIDQAHQPFVDPFVSGFVLSAYSQDRNEWQIVHDNCERCFFQEMAELLNRTADGSDLPLIYTVLSSSIFE